MVQSIKLNGREHMLNFGVAMLLAFKNDTGRDILDVFKEHTNKVLEAEDPDNVPFDFSTEEMFKVAYYGLKFGALKNNESWNYEEEEVSLWLDFKDLVKVLGLFGDSLNTEKEASEEEEKKPVQVK